MFGVCGAFVAVCLFCDAVSSVDDVPADPRVVVPPKAHGIKFFETKFLLFLPARCILNSCYEILDWHVFYHGAKALVSQGLLIIEDSWQNLDTPYSVGLLWTSDLSDAE
jgi:hypothetical protein